MTLIATCKTCGHQERLPEGAEGMRPMKGYERKCAGKCKGTTWQFIGLAEREVQGSRFKGQGGPRLTGLSKSRSLVDETDLEFERRAGR